MWVGSSPAILSANLLMLIAVGSIVLALLVYAGIALPAVWSTKQYRRKAATDVLGQILTVVRRNEPRKRLLLTSSTARPCWSAQGHG